KALLAGVDMDMMGQLYIKHLPAEVRAGRVPEAIVDEAVRRVLRTKFRIGLFEKPDVDPARVDAIFPSPQSRQAAREVARETLVLLQNHGDVLPVGAKTRSIAVIGPLADAPRDQIGPHGARGHAEDSVSVLKGIRDRAEAAGIEVRYAAGCDLMCRNTEQLPAALTAARESDLVIAVFGEPQELSGEAASRAHLTLNGKQAEILEALAATGKPIALVIIGGRPLELGHLPDKLPSILMAWYPGTEAGPAIADVLFGDYNPSGKLPVSWPRAIGQLPLYYNRLPTGRPTLPENRFTVKYIDEAISPLYPFGWGLSYSRFAYSDAAVVKAKLDADDALEASVTITNTSSRAGQEVAQLYIRDPVASRSRPLRQLKAFEKVTLNPGEAKRVTFRVPVKDLGFHLDDGTYLIEEGVIQVFVGGNSSAGPVGEAHITETIRIPFTDSRAGLSTPAAQ
ncbi:MAG: glycosyl hydrolase, partial [Microvirga sp.]|nr:glycosyl hydrolase [Microvirga sp.]